MSEVTGHFSGSLNFGKKLVCNRMSDGDRERGCPSLAFSEKHTVTLHSVWVADAEVITFGGIIPRNAVLLFTRSIDCKIQSQKKKSLNGQDMKDCSLGKNLSM